MKKVEWHLGQVDAVYNVKITKIQSQMASNKRDKIVMKQIR